MTHCDTHHLSGSTPYCESSSRVGHLERPEAWRSRRRLTAIREAQLTLLCGLAPYFLASAVSKSPVGPIEVFGELGRRMRCPRRSSLPVCVPSVPGRVRQSGGRVGAPAGGDLGFTRPSGGTRSGLVDGPCGFRKVVSASAIAMLRNWGAPPAVGYGRTHCPMRSAGPLVPRKAM